MNWLLTIAGLLLFITFLIIVVFIWYLQKTMGDSLPELSGEIRSDHLATGESVRIETDNSGVPRIIGQSQNTIAFGLGYAHARDRFFQMDLARRFAAGELAELLGGGKSIIENDKNVRRHRFRSLCRQTVENLNQSDRLYLDQYVAGVNQALNDLKKKPWEYSLLKCNPKSWQPEDSLLVSQSIYLFLEGGDMAFHQANGMIHDILPSALAAFLTQKGSAWDAPIVGQHFDVAPVPDASIINLRENMANLNRFQIEDWKRLETKVLGSNAWLVSGLKAHKGKHGPALLANDMHLSLGLPPTWYKVSLITEDQSGKIQKQVHGVTLPGGPPVVAGSNGKIAWGLTSAQGDWGDLLILELDPLNPRMYRTCDGWQEFDTFIEVISVRGGSDITIQIDWTIWGPVVDEDNHGRKHVWRWVAQESEGVNLNIGKLPDCGSVADAIKTAATCGVPHVNFLVGDSDGHIGWTIMGRIPRRAGAGQIDERLPMQAADPLSAWSGYLSSDEYPEVVDPPTGLIWSANHRMVDGEMLQKIGMGRYDRAVRATRIQQLLQSSDSFHEQRMLEIQMDHKSLLLLQWREMLLEELKPEIAQLASERVTFRNMIQAWSGEANAESVGYALLNECRLRIISEVISPLVQPIYQAEQASTKPRFHLRNISLETPAWSLLQSRPLHLLSPMFQSWHELILFCIDETIKHAQKNGWPRWGEVNRLRLSHPFGNKIPFLRPWLSAPVIYSSGSLTDMPGVQSPAFGASQRLAVFPGLEERAIMQLPGGQSGHPLSPHYLDLLHDWCNSGLTPLVSGPADQVLRIIGSG